MNQTQTKSITEDCSVNKKINNKILGFKPPLWFIKKQSRYTKTEKNIFYKSNNKSSIKLKVKYKIKSIESNNKSKYKIKYKIKV